MLNAHTLRVQLLSFSKSVLALAILQCQAGVCTGFVGFSLESNLHRCTQAPSSEDTFKPFIASGPQVMCFPLAGQVLNPSNGTMLRAYSWELNTPAPSGMDENPSTSVNRDVHVRQTRYLYFQEPLLVVSHTANPYATATSAD